MTSSTLNTLLVEDDATFAQIIQRALWGTARIKTARNIEDARKLLKENSFELVLLDKNLPDGIGTQLIPEIRIGNPLAVILVLTSDRLDDSVLEALASGASDYLHKSKHLASDLLGRITVARQRVALERRLIKVESLAEEKLKAEMIGVSPSLIALKDSIAIFGRQNINILIGGETGTGKELVARAINRACDDLSRPFVAVNCGALQENLIESELFGHVKGAFSGATNDRCGKVEMASGGDLFLDEIGDLPTLVQVKLLRVLSSGEYYRLGSDTLRHASFRVIAASHRDLRKQIKEGTFREDLFHRIACAELETSPLRERTEDIPYLVNHILKTEGCTKLTVSEDSIAWLSDQTWPGNVRELENVVKRAVVLSRARGSQIVELSDFQSNKGRPLSGDGVRASSRPGLRFQVALSREGYDQHVIAAKREYLQNALQQSGGNLVKAASSLGMHLTTLYRNMWDVGLETQKSRVHTKRERK